MAKQVWVRTAEAKDAAKFSEWMQLSLSINLFDPDVINYPTTVILCAHSDEPLVYMPIQMAIIMESLAPKPGISPYEEAVALRELTKQVVTMGRMAGAREAYFICKDDRVVDFAKKHGFEELPWKTLRLKFDRLERNEDSQTVGAGHGSQPDSEVRNG